MWCIIAGLGHMLPHMGKLTYESWCHLCTRINVATRFVRHPNSSLAGQRSQPLHSTRELEHCEWCCLEERRGAEHRQQHYKKAGFTFVIQLYTCLHTCFVVLDSCTIIHQMMYVLPEWANKSEAGKNKGMGKSVYY